MDKKTAMMEVKRLRKQAADKTIPQDVRNKSLDKIVEIESMFYDKAVKEEGMAHGGAVKKMAKGGDTHMMPDGTKMAGKTHGMSKGGAVKKDAEKKGMASKVGGLYLDGVKMISEDVNRLLGTKAGKALDKQKGRFAKGGYVNCGASVPASKGKK
jgi:hypothetical protein